MSIAVVGALHFDIIAKTSRFPRTDETLIGTDIEYRLGGKGGNQSIAAAMLGSKVAFCGCVGEDFYGALLRRELTLAGVNTDMLFQVDGPSGVSTVLVNEEGDYRSVIISGVNRTITEQLCNVKFASDASVLLLQNEIPETVNQQCLAMAREAGVRTILNAAPFRSMDRSVLEVVDIIVMNCIEARDFLALAGPDAGTSDLAGRLAEHEGPDIILTAGIEGVYHCRRGAIRHFPPHRVMVSNSLGAGDAFIGGLAHGLDQGIEMEEAIDQGQRHAAAVISGPARGGIALFSEHRQIDWGLHSGENASV